MLQLARLINTNDLLAHSLSLSYLYYQLSLGFPLLWLLLTAFHQLLTWFSNVRDHERCYEILVLVEHIGNPPVQLFQTFVYVLNSRWLLILICYYFLGELSLVMAHVTQNLSKKSHKTNLKNQINKPKYQNGIRIYASAMLFCIFKLSKRFNGKKPPDEIKLKGVNVWISLNGEEERAEGRIW